MAKATTKPTLRIGKLPDLTSVKMIIRVDPELHQLLEDCARIYNERYDATVGPAALVPSMLVGFLGFDIGFKKVRGNL